MDGQTVGVSKLLRVLLNQRVCVRRLYLKMQVDPHERSPKTTEVLKPASRKTERHPLLADNCQMCGSETLLKEHNNYYYVSRTFRALAYPDA